MSSQRRKRLLVLRCSCSVCVTILNRAQNRIPPSRNGEPGVNEAYRSLNNCRLDEYWEWPSAALLGRIVKPSSSAVLKKQFGRVIFVCNVVSLSGMLMAQRRWCSGRCRVKAVGEWLSATLRARLVGNTRICGAMDLGPRQWKGDFILTVGDVVLVLGVSDDPDHLSLSACAQFTLLLTRFVHTGVTCPVAEAVR